MEGWFCVLTARCLVLVGIVCVPMSGLATAQPEGEGRVAEEEAAPAGAPAAAITLDGGEEEAPSVPVQPLQGEPQDSVTMPAGLTLEAAQTLAVEQNPTLESALSRVRQAKQRVRQAWSRYFPTVFWTYDLSRTRFSGENLRLQRRAARLQVFNEFQRIVSGFGIGIPQQLNAGTLFIFAEDARRTLDLQESMENYTMSFQATWVLFDGFEREFTLAASRFARQEFEASYDEAQRLLLGAVADTYYQAQLSKALIDIAQADAAFNKRLLEDAIARRRVGTGSLSDQLNFDVQVNQAQASVISATRNYNVQLIALARLLGVPESEVPTGTALAELESERPEELTMPNANGLVAQAYELRPDLQASRLSVKRARATVGAEKGDFLPTVTATAAARGSNMDNGFSSEDFEQSINVGVSWDLFTGGRRIAEVIEAKEVQKEAGWDLQNDALLVAEDVRVALENLAAAQQSLILERRNVEIVRRTRDLVEKEYRAGQAALTRLNEAQLDLTTAEANLATALVDLRRAWAEVDTATGTILDAAPAG